MQYTSAATQLVQTEILLVALQQAVVQDTGDTSYLATQPQSGEIAQGLECSRVSTLQQSVDILEPQVDRDLGRRNSPHQDPLHSDVIPEATRDDGLDESQGLRPSSRLD